MNYNASYDYSKAIEDLLKQPASWDNYSKLKQLEESRSAKTKDPQFQQYANTQSSYSDKISQYGRGLYDTTHASEPRGGGMTTVREPVSYVQAPANQGIQYQVPQYDPYEQYRKAADTRLQSQLASIKAAYDKSRGSIQGAIPDVGVQAQKQRDMNDVYYQTQALPELRAALEQSGMYKGGAMPEGTIALNAIRGTNLGEINRQESSQLSQLQEALRQIEYEEGQANISAQAGIEADLAERLAQAQQFQQQYELQLAGLSGELPGGGQTLQAIQQAYNQAIAEAGLTGTYQGQATADERYRQWQQTFQENQAAWEQSANNPAVQAQILSNEITQLKLQYLPQEYNLQLTQLEQDIQAGRVSMDAARAQIAQIAEQSSLNREKFEYDKKVTDAEMSKAERNNLLNTYKGVIDNMFSSKSTVGDPYTSATKTEYNKAQIASYLQNLEASGIDPTVIDELLRYYGLSLGK